MWDLQASETIRCLSLIGSFLFQKEASRKELQSVSGFQASGWLWRLLSGNYIHPLFSAEKDGELYSPATTRYIRQESEPYSSARNAFPRQSIVLSGRKHCAHVCGQSRFLPVGPDTLRMSDPMRLNPNI